jgi:hypothetical protein
VKALRESGVDMSVGQTLGMPNLEATIARVAPGGGDVALAAQKTSMDDFQRAYLDEAGKFIGAKPLGKDLKPTARFAQTQKAFNDAYDAAKANMRVARDPEFDQAVADFRARLRDGVSFDPTNAKRLEKLLDDTLVRKVSGAPTGDTYKSLDSLFGKRRATFSKQGNGELADGVGELESILRSNAARNSSPEAIKALDDVDTGYSYLIRGEEAAKKAGTPAGEFSPQQLLSAVQKGDISARNRAFARGEARGQDFAQKGVETLGEGSLGPSALERGLGIAASGTMIPIAPNIAMGVANAPGVRPFLNTLIAGQRPEILREAGEAFAEMPYGFSAPVSAGTQTIQSILDTPRSSEELLANYGYREQPIQPDEPLVGPELSEMQRRYAQQRLRQVPAAEGEEMVQVQQAANPSAINLKEEGKFDPVTRTYLLPDGTRVDENNNIVQSNNTVEMATGGFVHALGEEPKAASAPQMYVPFAYAEGGSVQQLKKGGQPRLRDRARSFAKGATFAFNDEIEGLGRMLMSGRLSPEAYRDQVTRIRIQQKAYEDANPIESLAFEGAGSIVPAFIPGGQVAAAGRLGSLAAKTPMAVRRIAPVAAGAAAYGAGSANSMRDIPRSMAEEAAVGLGLYGAGSLAARPVKAGYRKVRSIFR